jgi:integrase/recombinase XerD
MSRRLQLIATGDRVAPSDGSPRSLRALLPGFLGRLVFLERSRATIKSYEDALESFLSFCDTHGLVYPRDVKPAAVEAFMASLRHHEGLAVSTVNHRRYVLVSFFRFLQREDLVTSNAAQIAEGLKMPWRLPDYIPSSRQVHLLEQLTKDRSPQGVRNLAIIGTGLLCGLRASELVTLRLPNLNLSDGTLKVVQGKGRRDRFVPVIAWLERVLDRYLTHARPAFLRGGHATDHVFLRRGGRPLTSRGLWHLVHRIVSPIVGRRIHPHTLRHSFASRALAGGGNLVALQKALGHSQPTTTMIYTHLPDDLYVRQFAAWLSGEAPAPEAVAPLPDLPEPMPTLPITPESTSGADDPADGPPPRPSHPFAGQRTREILRERRRDRRGRGARRARGPKEQ